MISSVLGASIWTCAGQAPALRLNAVQQPPCRAQGARGRDLGALVRHSRRKSRQTLAHLEPAWRKLRPVEPGAWGAKFAEDWN